MYKTSPLISLPQETTHKHTLVLLIVLKCIYSHHASVLGNPAMPSLLIVRMMLKCTGVFTDPVILFCDSLNQSIKRPARRIRIPGTSLHFGIRQDHSVIRPNLINKCSSPVPRQSQMKMLLCGSQQNDKDSTEMDKSSWTSLTSCTHGEQTGFSFFFTFLPNAKYQALRQRMSIILIL